MRTFIRISAKISFVLGLFASTYCAGIYTPHDVQQTIKQTIAQGYHQVIDMTEMFWDSWAQGTPSRRRHTRSQKVRVTVVGARIFPSKEGGSCWDMCLPGSQKELDQLSELLLLFGWKGWAAVMGVKSAQTTTRGTSMPDPYVRVVFGNGTSFQTAVARDTITPQWGTSQVLQLASHHSMQLYVRDKDLQDSDPIGHFSTASVPARYLYRGGVWKLRFHRVFELTLSFQPLPHSTAPAFQPGRYQVTVLHASIQPRKADGRRWDVGMVKPDPYVLLRIGKHHIQTRIQQDTLNPLWNDSRVVTLSGKEELTYRIIDSDWYSDDLIGRCSVAQVKEILSGKEQIYRARCGQAQEIAIRFQRITD